MAAPQYPREIAALARSRRIAAKRLRDGEWANGALTARVFAATWTPEGIIAIVGGGRDKNRIINIHYHFV